MELTKEQLQKHGEVILAWANGAEVEVKGFTSGEWRGIDRPAFDTQCEYRVKPQPTYQERHAQWVKETGIKVGDQVKIVRGFENEEAHGIGFLSEMSEHIGKVGTVSGIYSNDVSVAINKSNAWSWPYFCLEVIKPTYRPYTMAEAEQHLLGAKVRRKDNGRACLCNLDSSLHNYFDNYTYLDGSPCGMQETPQES